MSTDRYWLEARRKIDGAEEGPRVRKVCRRYIVAFGYDPFVWKKPFDARHLREGLEAGPHSVVGTGLANQRDHSIRRAS